MNATPEHSSVVREIGRVLLRHRKKALLAFLLTVTAAVGVVVFWPRVYRSEARLFVRVGRESVALDPTATTEAMIPVTTSREVEINSVLEMLRSRAMLEQVVDVMGTERVLQQASMPAVGRESATPSWLPPSISLSRWIPALDPVSPKEAAVSKLLKAFDMHAVKRSSIICVGSEAASPELARDILKHLLDVYVAEHARLNRTQGSHDFFREQTELLRKQLADITETLRDTKNRFHLVSVDGQRNALQTELTSVETNLFQAEAALASSQGENQTLAGFLADTSERVMTDEVTGLPNQAGDAMRGQLYDLEIQEAEMASKFADRYPLLKAIREQRQRAEKVFSRQEARRTQWTTSVNPRPPAASSNHVCKAIHARRPGRSGGCSQATVHRGATANRDAQQPGSPDRSPRAAGRPAGSKLPRLRAEARRSANG